METTRLDLSGLGLTSVPSEIGRLTALKKLDLSNNQLTALPPEIGRLTTLLELHLDDNRLSALLPEIGQLTALTMLGLHGNQLSTLPPEIGQLTLLKWLDLGGNQICSLPPEIGQIGGLTTLYLGGNRLTTLPSQICQLSGLTMLRLGSNRLSALPREIGALTGLTELDLSSNQLSTLPSEIGQLAALTTLGLSGNHLDALPPEIGRLTTLRMLYIRGNHLSGLPVEIGQLTALTGLYAQGNQLSKLPPEIGRLTALTELDLVDNQLSVLPSEIRRLTALEGLFLHGNDRLGIPSEILGPTWEETSFKSFRAASPQAILDYYFRIRGQGGRVLGECKLLVVGRGGAGKTSLVKRLNGEPLDPHEPETHGITIQPLQFDCAQGPVTSRVWDFGGQIVLHSMHEFFLTARSLYLLVLGERDDALERDATYWLQLIRSYAGNAPVVIALNKSAGRQRQFDRATLEKDYGPILGWVFTECAEEDPAKGGITILRDTLTAALDSSHMDSVRRKFPSAWFKIKSALENMAESYLDYDAYVSKCEDCGITDTQEQASLAADLHDLGVALNYGRDPCLRDTTVLRPDWLANGIYAVLRANDVDASLPPEFRKQMAPDGIVTEGLLEQIHRKAEAWHMLQAADYPRPKREFLLRLMELFHLSYPVDDSGTEQLVPTLLPPQPPEGPATEPQGEGSVQVRYELQVVPGPLLPWFVARTFSMIPNRLHWRRGTMLVFGDAQARVWTTPEEQYVFVTVAGPPRQRDRLLGIIRAILRDLFNDYRRLEPVEQWKHKGMWVPRLALEEFGVLPKTGERIPTGSPEDGEVPS